MKTIISVEDEKPLSEIICDELSESGYKVFSANSGKECMELLKTITPDLVILDIKLPDTSGLQILQEIRRKSATLPIIMCSAYDSFKADYEVWSSKIADYIVKPIDLDDLKNKVKIILGE
ncbi:MAG: hypothetical protein A2474_01720 [Elusimicrobia bacterium RIFOXYC2_FULL_34_12]|nr:MAG: hypothetical protein A2474_01720 [Elusimicrobia bacterium RIFOXYC2_FULL_34_12]OGS39621.1 MAG: hypothetical protein A2551_04005 [Elusimicrobia bacterium RIFOXYD2_FULL_34_30]HAM39384.1 two-component system response regulator [Elusimicrobiota bacterium]